MDMVSVFLTEPHTIVLDASEHVSRKKKNKVLPFAFLDFTFSPLLP